MELGSVGELMQMRLMFASMLLVALVVGGCGAQGSAPSGAKGIPEPIANSVSCANVNPGTAVAPSLSTVDALYHADQTTLLLCESTDQEGILIPGRWIYGPSSGLCPDQLAEVFATYAGKASQACTNDKDRTLYVLDRNEGSLYALSQIAECGLTDKGCS